MRQTIAKQKQPRSTTAHYRRVIWAVVLCTFAVADLKVRSSGINLNGVDARTAALGGAGVSLDQNALGAMTANPAALGFLDTPEINFGALAGLVQGDFKKVGSGGSLDNTLHGISTAALAFPLGKLPVTLGLSFAPDSASLADWHYNDPLGGLGGATSYGYQENRSQIALLRTAFGAGWKVNHKLAFGASIGLLYNQNELKTPYIFQNLQPGVGGPNNAAYNGAKTLLDLQTSGWGWNVHFGGLYKATTNLTFGLTYKTETRISTTGDAYGDPSTQFGAPLGTLPFHYDAEVRNIFPQEITAGAAWKFQPKWRLALQVDWIDWSHAFRTLPVSLSHGNNGTVNSVLGDDFKDLVPLNWKDSFVYRAGLEYAATERLSLRGGYAYGHNPVPSGTLTPMTAAIFEHTLSAGIGYQWSRYAIDFAYQYALPVTQNIGTSDLQAGEYSNSSIQVSNHLLLLTTGVKF